MEVRDDTIYFAKLKKDAIIPSKNKENGGYDIYSYFEEDYVEIMPHETIMIPTGISSVFSDDYVMILKERGSTGTKGIAQRCGVIDSGFRGEWKVPITNTTDTTIVIKKKNGNYKEDERGIIVLNASKNKREEYYLNYNIYPYEKAICQAIIIQIPKMNIKEIPYDELQKIPSIRGNGMLGSSGK